MKLFLKIRVAFIELNEYQSPKFQIDIGVPQGSLSSSSLFIFLNDFVSNQAQKFKFANDISLIVKGKDPSELSAVLRQTCSDIEKWRVDGKMLVNEEKLNLSFSIAKRMTSNSRASMVIYVKLKRTTKSLGVPIDSKLNYRDHSSKTIERAMRNWNLGKSVCNRKWSLAVSTLVLFYKTTILPSLFYAAPIWLEKNLGYVTAVQKNFIRTVFGNGFSPNIDLCQVLLVTPPLDFLSTAIKVKFLLTLKLEDDLLYSTLDASSYFPDSIANLPESHLTRFEKLLRIKLCTRYKQQDVSLFKNHLWNLRWKNNDNKSFLKCCTKIPSTCKTTSPFFNLQRYEAIQICEVLIGKSFALADYAWKHWQAEYPLCRCGKSEEAADHLFLAYQGIY